METLTDTVREREETLSDDAVTPAMLGFHPWEPLSLIVYFKTLVRLAKAARCLKHQNAVLRRLGSMVAKLILRHGRRCDGGEDAVAEGA